MVENGKVNLRGKFKSLVEHEDPAMNQNPLFVVVCTPSNHKCFIYVRGYKDLGFVLIPKSQNKSSIQNFR